MVSRYMQVSEQQGDGGRERERPRGVLPGSAHEISLFTDGRGGKRGKPMFYRHTIFRISFSWEVEDRAREGGREGSASAKAE